VFDLPPPQVPVVPTNLQNNSKGKRSHAASTPHEGGGNLSNNPTDPNRINLTTNLNAMALDRNTACQGACHNPPSTPNDPKRHIGILARNAIEILQHPQPHYEQEHEHEPDLGPLPTSPLPTSPPPTSPPHPPPPHPSTAETPGGKMPPFGLF